MRSGVRRALAPDGQGSDLQQVAAIIVEPIQGGGNIVPPDFWLFNPSPEFGAANLDETQTGSGAPGAMWASSMIISPGRSDGGQRHWQGFLERRDLDGENCNALPYFSGYPATEATLHRRTGILEIILKEKLVENSRRLGAALLSKFKNFEERFEFVGEARGRGLMIGIELVKDKKTRERVGKKVCHRIFHDCLKRGLLSMTYSNPIRIIPPLTISEKYAIQAVAILEEVFTEIQKDGSYRA
jgi:4-aminobutyrate aminotransferase-like enzyme